MALHYSAFINAFVSPYIHLLKCDFQLFFHLGKLLVSGVLQTLQEEANNGNRQLVYLFWDFVISNSAEINE